MDHHKPFSVLLVLLLHGSLPAYGTISPKVIALQQVLSSELQTLERNALLTGPLHAESSSDGSAISRLRRTFHEFERQNQESITAILRVLALIDHTLENTIQDCEKVFQLPSLYSENVLFRDVTRPLLLLFFFFVKTGFLFCFKIKPSRSPTFYPRGLTLQGHEAPLLLLVEQLCQQITLEDFAQIESSLEAVEQAATHYRSRLDETKHSMQVVLDELDH
ncbi:uncharacterized protein LOC121590402, partial [Anopheles merus]|uniref:uncharacterized protein LOC121590402 n=1 Tax=Anopheles merus TaxID=30066 RepID=UPI001BE3F935